MQQKYTLTSLPQITIAADARLSNLDYADDQIWELVQQEGKSPALSLQTTFGLRVRWLRLFPCFIFSDRLVYTSADFAQPPQLLIACPNYLKFNLSPFTNIDTLIEYWVPQSHAVAGRLSFINKGDQPEKFQVCWAGTINPISGDTKLTVNQIGDRYLLHCETNGLYITCTMSGQPQPSTIPFPALGHVIRLSPGDTQQIIWALAALPSDQNEVALHALNTIIGCPWEAEISRIELTNIHDQIEIITGDPEWDHVFALSQRIAYSLFTSSSNNLPNPSFLLTRQPDQGFSLHGNGLNYSAHWKGPTPLDTYYLASMLLPGGLELIEGALKNFLTAQDETEFIDCKSGLAKQRMPQLAQPILASLTLKIDQYKHDHSWLKGIYPALIRFLKLWFSPEHDRDGDGFPEWNYPAQFGLEESPIVNQSHPHAQGIEITQIESPALAAMLLRECKALIKIATYIEANEDITWLEEKATHLQDILNTVWDAKTCTYHYQDFQTHQSNPGLLLFRIKGKNGKYAIRHAFKTPHHLLIKIISKGTETQPLTILLSGKCHQEKVAESINVTQFDWSNNCAFLTTGNLFTRLEEIKIEGLQAGDKVEIRTPDYTLTDISCLLPLWARISTPTQAQAITVKTIKRRFLKNYGICISPQTRATRSVPPWKNISLPWNQLIGEALLANNQQALAAELVTRIMRAIIQNLKHSGCFFEFIDGQTGQGIGKRNHLRGLAPQGLFLSALGIQIRSNREVILQGVNPFPWPVIVKYQGMTVSRRFHETSVTFPTGQFIKVDNQPYPTRIALP